jgi:hypothetical protein
LLQRRLLPALALKIRHGPFCAELGRRRHEALGKLQSLTLNLLLRLEMRDFCFGAFDERIEALAFGRGAVLFSGNLPVDEIALEREDIENGLIDILAIRRNLIGGNRKKRFSFLDLLPVFHVKLFDKALLWDEDFCGANGRRQIASDGFLPSVLRNGKKAQNEHNNSCQKPREDLGRYRLEQYDRGPVAVLVLKINRFLPE